MHLVWKRDQWVPPIYYCKANPYTCGQGCRDNLNLHRQITGALTSDDYAVERPLILPEEIDDDVFAFAMQTLGAR